MSRVTNDMMNSTSSGLVISPLVARVRCATTFSLASGAVYSILTRSTLLLAALRGAALLLLLN